MDPNQTPDRQPFSPPAPSLAPPAAPSGAQPSAYAAPPVSAPPQPLTPPASQPAYQPAQAQQPQAPQYQQPSTPLGQQPGFEFPLPGQPAPQSAGQPQPSQPQPTHIRDSLAQRGYDVSGFSSDDELLAAVEQGQAIAEQYQLVSPHMREYLAQRDEFYRWQEQQRAAGHQSSQQPQQAQPGQQKKPAAWELPEYDENWARYAKWDETRQEYVPRDQWANPVAAEKLNAYARALQQRQTEFWRNPHEVVWQGIQDRINEQVQATIQQFHQQQTAQQQAMTYLQQHASELYVTDPNGRPQVDPAGNPLLRPKGQALWNYIEQLRQAGVTDTLRRNQLAIQMLEADDLRQRVAQAQQPQQPLPGQPGPSPQQPAPPAYSQQPGPAAPLSPAMPPKQQQEETFIQRALAGQRHMPNRAGTVVTSQQPGAPPQNPELDFEQMALSTLAQRNGHAR